MSSPRALCWHGSTHGPGVDEEPELRLVVASSNFGGGVGVVAAGGAEGAARVDELASFLADPNGDGAVADSPRLGLVQEMTRLVEPPVDYPATVRQRIGPEAESFYIVCNSTERYPWREKWGRRWDVEGIRHMEEGMATFGTGGASLSAPWLDHGERPVAVDARGLALDLPIVRFADGEDDRDGWLGERVPWAGDSRVVSFRPSFYQGNRDTDPRAATAHHVIATDGAEDVELVVINVHLGTLRNENRGEARASADDGVTRIVRERTPEAALLRRMHTRVLGSFIARVYRELALPVVIAGDFNAAPDAWELACLLEEAMLVPTFETTSCWRCGRPVSRPQPPKRYWTDPENRSLLSEAPDEVSRLTGRDPVPISATEHCGNEGCEAPLFTHKTNFRLIDNVLYTNPAMAGSLGLRFVLALADPPNDEGRTRGLLLRTSYSDHLPIFATFEGRRV